MAIYLKQFETVSQYNTYTADTANFIKPNVSLITENNKVEYNPLVIPPTPSQPNNVITYTASEQIVLPGNAVFSGESGELTIISHTFENGVGTIEFDDDIITIGENSFNYCLELTSVNIPNSVTSMGNGVFTNCSSLASINIPSGVTSIGDSAFNECSSLTSIDIPSGVTSIGESAFKYCTSLTSIDIPSGVTRIEMDAFFGCENVNDVYCYPNPSLLVWNESEHDDFKEDGSTLCHVKSEWLSDYQSKFGYEVNVTFVGDLV